MRYSATVAVPCRIEEVFASLIDRTSHPKLKSQSVEQTPPGEIGLGTTFRYRMAGHPEFTHATRLCDFEPTTILRWQTDWPGREPWFEWYELRSLRDRTIVCCRAEFVRLSRWRLLDPIAAVFYWPIYQVGAHVGIRLLGRRIRSRRSVD